jgi:hypothetical protein
MADPTVETRARLLEVETALANTIAREVALLKDRNYLEGRAAQLTAEQVQEHKNLTTSLTSANAQVIRSVGLNTDLARSYRDVGSASSGARSSITDSKGATEFLQKSTAATIDTLISFRDELEGISEDRYDFVTSISEAIGGSSRFYALYAKDVSSFNEEIGSYQADNLARTRTYYNNLGALAKVGGQDLTEAQMQVIGSIGAGADAFQKGQFAARKFFGLSTGFLKEGDQMIPDSFFRIQGVPIDVVFGSAEAAMRPLTELLADETLTKTFSERINDEKSARAVVDDTMRMSTAIKAFGITSAQTTELVRLNYINTGEASTDYFNSVVKAATYGEKAFGYSSQLIISDVIKMSNNFDTFGFRSAEDLAKISAAAHDAHLSISDLQNVMGKFNTFESAAGAVGQLNAALGTNFDALEMMTLKFEDPAQFIQRLRDGFMAAGKTFEDLPQTYRTMITQQLGITMEGLRGIMDGSARNLDDLTKRQEDASALYESSGTTETERQIALDEIVKGRVKITGEMNRAAGDMIEQAQRAANRYENTTNIYIQRTREISDSINDAASKIASETAPKFTEQIEKQVKAMSTILVGVLSNAKLTKDAITGILQGVALAIAEADRLATDFEKNHPGFMKAFTLAGEVPVATAGATDPGTHVKDLYVSPGGSTVVTANFGEMNEKTFTLDKRDALVAKPPPEPVTAPATAQRNNLPAVSDAVRASLQSVGTSLRIELDVGQLTDLVLRDIMMNKPSVFGGIA